MSEQIINAFVAPAKRIWEMELGHALDLKKADPVTSSITTDDVSVYITVNGDAPGIVIYGFSIGTARKVVGKMMGEEVKRLDDVANSALAELANMITVHASAELSASGIACTFNAPLILQPAGVPIKYMANPHVRASFGSDLGSLNIHIGLASTSRDEDVDWLMQRWL
jgi:chemotaxis protein CheX